MLSTSTAASRICRVSLFIILVCIMLHTGMQIYLSTYSYRQRLAKNKLATQSETKKRSTDFEPAKWGWADQATNSKDASANGEVANRQSV